jgi:uncharacterized membrane protein
MNTHQFIGSVFISISLGYIFSEAYAFLVFGILVVVFGTLTANKE